MIACADTGQDGELQNGSPAAYMDNGDGTITDMHTGLMWEKLSDDGSIHDMNNGYTWADAFTRIDSLNTATFAGFTDWRVPNVNELQSLVDYGTMQPSVDAAFNTGCISGCTVTSCSCTKLYNYWSSTTHLYNTQWAWFVDFTIGDVYPDAKTGYFSYRQVRAVRGGL